MKARVLHPPIITNKIYATLGFAHPAGGTGPDTAVDGGCCAQGFFIFSDQKALFDPVVDEIPREPLRHIALSVDIKIRIEGRRFEGLGPISPVAVHKKQQLRHSPISPGQNTLDICPPGHIGVYADIGDGFEPGFDPFDFLL